MSVLGLLTNLLECAPSCAATASVLNQDKSAVRKPLFEGDHPITTSFPS